MYYVSNLTNGKVYVTDTSDGAVDEFTKDELKSLMLSNPDLAIKGVGIKADTVSSFSFRFATYELTENEIKRINGAKTPVTRFGRLPNERQARNHYYCGNCDTLVDNKPNRCPSCKAEIIYPTETKVKNFITDMSGSRYFFSSVNGARNMLKDRAFRQREAIAW